MEKANGNGINHQNNSNSSDAVTGIEENPAKPQIVSIDPASQKAQYMANPSDPQQDPLLDSSKAIDPTRTPVSGSPSNNARSSPATSKNSKAQAFVTLACVCLVNLLNYMDRFTIPGKLLV